MTCRLTADCTAAVLHAKKWKRKKDSNLRVWESKSHALTNLAIPLEAFQEMLNPTLACELSCLPTC